MSVCLISRPLSSAPATNARAGPPPFNHARCAPAPALAPFVDYYWITKWDRRGQPPRAAASLLDPCVHLHIQDGRADVMGLLRGTLRVRIEDTGCVVGVKFRAGGFYPFVQRPVVAFTDRLTAVADVFATTDGWARELTHAVVACEGDGPAHAAIIAAHLDAFLGARVPERDVTAERVGDLVAMIAGNAALRRIGDLVEASGRSERTLHRRFSRYVGASPAWVIKRYRLQEAARRLTATPPADVRDVAWDLGYADQAHFIRDFRATIGVSPGAYARRD